MARFFARANLKQRQHAIRYVGWALMRAEGRVPAEVLVRLQRLWDWRYATLVTSVEGAASDRHVDAQEELAEFSTWFASRAFDTRWVLQRFREVVRITGGTEGGGQALEYFAELAGDYPVEAVEALAQFKLSGGENPWRVHLWREPAKVILSRARQSGNPAASSAAVDLINRWIAAGHIDFAALLRE